MEAGILFLTQTVVPALIAVLVFRINLENRLTKLETQMNLILTHYGVTEND
jgi:hypothetical protein